jgi:hypothetical protein
MKACQQPTPEMFQDAVQLTLEADHPTFEEARRAAYECAQAQHGDPMLLSWFDRRRGYFSPNVECCDERKPSWVIYAETRGADLVVDINGEAFVFMFRDANGLI